MKILLLASQHGDELLGEKLYEYLKRSHLELLPSIEFKIANPPAHQRGVRFIVSDMNRSYTTDLKTDEAILAAKLLKYIRQQQFDLVLDLHTTRCVQPPCLIVRRVQTRNERFISASSYNHIVLMRDRIVESSLIGNVDSAVSVEVSGDDLGDEIYEQLCSDIRRYIDGERSSAKKDFFEVLGLLRKDELPASEANRLVNFQKSSRGFYPILVGENSYKKNTDYLGFKARKVRYNESND